MTQVERGEIDQGLTSSTPPSHYTSVRDWTLTGFIELATLRRELREAIQSVERLDRDTLADVPESMILVASELSTNAIKHGRPPVLVHLRSGDSRFLLEVVDHDPHTAPQFSGNRALGAGGFGLQIARQVGQEVGWYTTDATKHIWVTFAVRDA